MPYALSSAPPPSPAPPPPQPLMEAWQVGQMPLRCPRLPGEREPPPPLATGKSRGPLERGEGREGQGRDRPSTTSPPNAPGLLSSASYRDRGQALPKA